jgi:hypothetical protein
VDHDASNEACLLQLSVAMRSRREVKGGTMAALDLTPNDPARREGRDEPPSSDLASDLETMWTVDRESTLVQRAMRFALMIAALAGLSALFASQLQLPVALR